MPNSCVCTELCQEMHVDFIGGVIFRVCFFFFFLCVVVVVPAVTLYSVWFFSPSSVGDLLFSMFKECNKLCGHFTA